MKHNIVGGSYVNIPYNCPMTVRHFGKILKPEKRNLLGKKAYVQRVEGDKIVVSAISSNSTPYGGYWYFHAFDLIVEENPKEVPPVKIEIQTFDPDNLVI
jgi:hypothetical protein